MAFSGRNGKIVLSAVVGGAYRIYTVNDDGSALTSILPTGRNGRMPSVSPDGVRIVYRHESSPIGLHAMNMDGTSDVQIVADSTAMYPSYTSDGKILYHARVGGTGAYHIFRRTADGLGTATDLSGSLSGDHLQPVMSNDGTKIAFIRSGTGLYVMDATGANQTLLISDASASDPEWHPDGSRIMYATMEGSARVLKEAHVSTAAQGMAWDVSTVGWPTSSDGGFATYSPDGERITFSRRQTGHSYNDIVVTGARPDDVSIALEDEIMIVDGGGWGFDVLDPCWQTLAFPAGQLAVDMSVDPTIDYADPGYIGGAALNLDSVLNICHLDGVEIYRNSRVWIWAKGMQSGGSPSVQLMVDDVNAGSPVVINSATLAYYTFGVSVPPGLHKISFKPINVAVGRQLLINYVEFDAWQ